MRTLAFLSLLLLSACASPALPGQPARTAAGPGQGTGGRADTLARIHALVGTPSCSGDGECRSLAIGARPCGGPEGYLAYSAARTPEAELRALGDIYRAERRNAHAQAGRVSDCRFLPDPGALCRAGTCQAGAAQPIPR